MKEIRSIDFTDFNESRKWVSNRLIRLDEARELDTSEPYIWKRVEEHYGNDDVLIATKTAEYTLFDKSLREKLKGVAIMTYYADLKEAGAADLASFILHPPKP